MVDPFFLAMSQLCCFYWFNTVCPTGHDSGNLKVLGISPTEINLRRNTMNTVTITYHNTGTDCTLRLEVVYHNPNYETQIPPEIFIGEDAHRELERIAQHENFSVSFQI